MSVTSFLPIVFNSIIALFNVPIISFLLSIACLCLLIYSLLLLFK